MANFSDQLEEITTLLCSTTTKSQKSVAYSTLLHFQEQSSSATGDLSLIHSLADTSTSLLPPILTDISDEDEEIAVQALKCLGFMIYHPTLVATFSRDDANLVVDSLTKVIKITKIKSVCNLGVWCLSVQQFPSLYLAANFDSLLRAIVHALDNPIGSLSTTFEATQAVTKLATQLHEKMRDASNIWAPPIYRRLVSIDKRVRDISERCLLKIRSTTSPPSLSLSKAVVVDMKGKLLPGMKELLNHGLKIQAIHAWGWFIRLLGPYAVKNRHLINEILKIPEQTFPDADPQIQIASLVAWEGLIDALIWQGGKRKGNNSGTEGETLSKSLKLVMAPIIGIMSSRCDVSVYSSCLNTWCYLLHTLDSSVNTPLMIKSVWEPVFYAVFQVTPDSKNSWVWTTCLDLLDDFILTKSGALDSDLNNQVNYQLSDKVPTTKPPIDGKHPWKHHPIQWLAWDLSKLDFCFKIIQNLISQGPVIVLMEVKCFLYDSALRIFRSVMKGVQNVFNNPSTNYDEVMLCLNKILGLLKEICESIISENNGSRHTSLQFVEVVIEEIEPSILGSPLYKVALDLKYIHYLNSVNVTGQGELVGIRSKVYMDTVSPIVYLINLYFCGVFKSTFNAPEAEFIMEDACRYIKITLSSFEPSEILHNIVGLLYEHVGFEYLKVWVAISKGLKEYIDEVKDISLLTLLSDVSNCLALCHVLSYPFAVCSGHQVRGTMVQSNEIQESAIISLQSKKKLELELVFDVWKSLYVCVNHASHLESSTSNDFADDLAVALNAHLDEDMKVLECGTEVNPSNDNQSHDLLFLCANAVICVLEDIQISAVSSTGSRRIDDGYYKQFSSINNILRLTARFLALARMMAETVTPSFVPLISRVFSALVRFVGWLHMKEDILSFVQIISTPLLPWMLAPEVTCEDTQHQLQLLWTETLNRMQKSRPPLTFDTSFLELQAPLLEKTLDHPNPSISNPTITFWNSTYAKEKLDYPQSLVPILDKLSRNRKINLFKRSIPNHSGVIAPQRYKVSTATQNRSSKRVELLEDNGKGCLGLKRKRKELTEHQKEVRRAQQGRERDCNGHGPGIRTYTGVDFSQGNEESQDSEEIRDAESILELLRKASS